LSTLCDHCKIDYPDDLVSAFRSSNGNFMLCGICALAAKNAVHGTNFKKFNGEITESLRQRAIAFRKKAKLATT